MPAIPDLSTFYSESEANQLAAYQAAYSQALANLQLETQKNSDAKAGHSTYSPMPGVIKWSNPVVNGGQPLSPEAYNAWIANSDALLVSLQNLAIQKKVDLDEYREQLNTKYQLAFDNAHPEIAQQQIDANTQQAIAQTQANTALAKTEAELAAEAADAKEKNKVWLIVGICAGVALLIGVGIWAYSKFKSTKKD